MAETPSFPQALKTLDGRDLVIDYARPEDIPEIINFLMAHLLPKPPVRQLCQVDDEDFQQPGWLLEDATKGTNQPISLLIRDTSVKGQPIVACVMNDIQKRPAAGQPSEHDV